MNNSLGPLSEKLGVTSGIMGDFVVQLLKMADIEHLGPIMDQNNKFLEKFSSEAGDGRSAFEDLVSIFLQAYKAISPLTNKFGDFLVKLLDSKAAFLESEDGLASLTEFFNRAGRRMGSFFRMFQSLTGVFSTIFKSAEVPIDQFLTFLEVKFDGMNKSAKDNTGAITQHFEHVFDNMKPMVELVGELGLMFLKMGAAPELRTTFETLKGALPFIQKIIDVAAESGPSFAKLVVAVAELFSKFADTGSMEVFFDTLTGIADTLNRALDNEIVANVLKIAGPILAAVKAMTLFKTGVGQVGKILLGG